MTPWHFYLKLKLQNWDLKQSVYETSTQEPSAQFYERKMKHLARHGASALWYSEGSQHWSWYLHCSQNDHDMYTGNCNCFTFHTGIILVMSCEHTLLHVCVRGDFWRYNYLLKSCFQPIVVITSFDGKWVSVIIPRWTKTRPLWFPHSHLFHSFHIQEYWLSTRTFRCFDTCFSTWTFYIWRLDGFNPWTFYMSRLDGFSTLAVYMSRLDGFSSWTFQMFWRDDWLTLCLLSSALFHI